MDLPRLPPGSHPMTRQDEKCKVKIEKNKLDSNNHAILGGKEAQKTILTQMHEVALRKKPSNDALWSNEFNE